MIITEASAADIPEICLLVNSAYRGDTSRKGWTTEADLLDGKRIDESILQQYFLNPETTILKCVDNELQIAGCVYLKKEKKELHLGMLTVSPLQQAKGIGKILLQASEEKARKKDCCSVIMTVISVRQELINWYKKQGYQETGETHPFPDDERFGKPKFPLQFIVLRKKL